MAESATQERGFQATNAHRVVQALISLKMAYTTPCAKIAIQATIPRRMPKRLVLFAAPVNLKAVKSNVYRAG